MADPCFFPRARAFWRDYLGVLVLADGTADGLGGGGFGAVGDRRVGGRCASTPRMNGYQEVMTESQLCGAHDRSAPSTQLSAYRQSSGRQWRGCGEQG